MKKTIIVSVLVGMVMTSSSVFADDRDDVRVPSAPEISSIVPVTERQETLFTKVSSRLKSRGNQLINERINSLESNKKAIQAAKSLTEEQKNNLSAILTANVTGLQLVRAQIASSTDATSTKALVDSIFTNFRIYGVVIPQVRLEKRIYDLQNHSTKLSETFLKVQSKIDEYKAKGKDVTVWQKNLEDAKIMVATDMGILANLSTKVMAMKVSDYGTTSKMIIESANKEMKSVAKNFNSIAKNLHKPYNLKNNSSHASSSRER